MLEVERPIGQQRPQRARASLQRASSRPPATAPPAAGSPAEDAIVATFARAWESADLDALVALLTDDVFIAMPPSPSDTRQELVAATAPASSPRATGSTSCRPEPTATPVRGIPARPAGIRHATAFYVLTLTGGRICGMTRFEASVLPWFGLPRSLPSR